MMTGKSFEESRKEFLAMFRGVALYKHRYDVFRDFVTMSAISLRNAVVKDEDLEQEYLRIIASYEKDDQLQFPKLLALLVELLEHEPTDVLGGLFEMLELTSKDKGQFFTPNPISQFMSQILGCEDLKHLDKPFITLSEPACGAGGMVLSFVKQVLTAGHNPAERLWVQAIDIDRMAALMCYVQLSSGMFRRKFLLVTHYEWSFERGGLRPLMSLETGPTNFAIKLKSKRQKGNQNPRCNTQI